MDAQFFFNTCSQDLKASVSVAKMIEDAKSYLASFKQMCKQELDLMCKSPLEEDRLEAQRIANKLGFSLNDGKNTNKQGKCQNGGFLTDYGCQCPVGFSGAFCEFSDLESLAGYLQSSAPVAYSFNVFVSIFSLTLFYLN